MLSKLKTFGAACIRLVARHRPTWKRGLLAMLCFALILPLSSCKSILASLLEPEDPNEATIEWEGLPGDVRINGVLYCVLQSPGHDVELGEAMASWDNRSEEEKASGADGDYGCYYKVVNDQGFRLITLGKGQPVLCASYQYGKASRWYSELDSPENLMWYMANVGSEETVVPLPDIADKVISDMYVTEEIARTHPEKAIAAKVGNDETLPEYAFYHDSIDGIFRVDALHMCLYEGKFFCLVEKHAGPSGTVYTLAAYPDEHQDTFWECKALLDEAME